MSSLKSLPVLCISAAIQLGCGGAAESNPNQSVFQDASADCKGCVYMMRGLTWADRIAVGGGWLYLADGTAAQVRRVPLAGGSEELVSEHVKVTSILTNDSALYFTGVDSANSDIDFIWRVDHASGQRTTLARYSSDDGEPLYLFGVDGDGPIMMGTAADGVTALYRLAEEGTRTVLRRWASVDASPALDCMSLLPDGELVWCDPVEGLWSAPTFTEAGVHTSTGWRVAHTEVHTTGLAVCSAYLNDPDRVQRIYQRELDDTNEHLTEVARASDDLIRPPWVVAVAGVVGVGSESSQLRFWNLEASPVNLVPSNLILVNTVFTASDNALYFAAYRAGGRPSVYRMPLARLGS